MYFGVFSIAGVIFMVVLYFLMQKTIQLSRTNLPVKANLERIITIVKEYVKRYTQLGVLLMPVCFVFAIWLSYNDPGKIPKPINWEVVLYMSIAMLVISAGFYYFTKWYLQKLYGDYIDQLQDSLDELEE